MVEKRKLVASAPTYLWNDSVNVLTTTHARTNRSNVIPGGGPYPPAGPDAEEERVWCAWRTSDEEIRTILLLNQTQDRRGQIVPEAS